MKILFWFQFFAAVSIAQATPEKSCEFLGLPAKLEEYYMRVLRDPTGKFESMSDDPHRHVVMFSKGVAARAVLSLNPNDRLISLGYKPEKIRELQELGTRFQLILVHHSSITAHLANWEGLIKIIRQAYSNGAAAFVENQLHELAVPKNTPDFGNAVVANYRRLEALGPHKFLEVKGSRGTPRFIDETAMLTRNDLNPAWRARAFLEHELKLTELFSGTGYILKEDMTLGEPEYFVLNQNLADVQGLLPFSLDPLEK